MKAPIKIDVLLAKHSVIAAVKDDASLQIALLSNCQIIFILYGSICNIGQLVEKVKAAKKYAFIHVDLLDGTSNKEVVIDFLKASTCADGIISTKISMIKAAKLQGFYTVHRLFVVDSISYYNIGKQISQSKPDCIEILPGCMPKVLTWVASTINLPIIAGGLVCDKEDAEAALNSGAIAISSTNINVWGL
jgi:glycerol uptake operon antiterminator